MYIQTLLQKGNYIEELIKNKINEREDLEVILHNKTHGVDLLVESEDGEIFSIEVKSANKFIKQFRKKQNKYSNRAGNFFICPDDLDRADLFVFVITEKNSKNISPENIFFIDPENVRKFLKNRKKDAKRYVITINQLSLLEPKSKLSYFI
jgi:hypothetical protein